MRISCPASFKAFSNSVIFSTYFCQLFNLILQSLSEPGLNSKSLSGLNVAAYITVLNCLKSDEVFIGSYKSLAAKAFSIDGKAFHTNICPG